MGPGSGILGFLSLIIVFLLVPGLVSRVPGLVSRVPGLDSGFRDFWNLASDHSAYD